MRLRGRLTSWDGLAVAATSMVAGAVALSRVPDLLSRVPACPFLHATGLPCGTCGFTRAFARVASLDFAHALPVSPLGTMLVVACAVFAGWVALARLFHPRIRLPLVRPGSRPARWVVRFGVPLAFLLNWAYGITVTLATGAPPA
ncbi:MAG TPA: DUF2752 domain-containing protein [Vulgatibacter sp.]